MSKTTLFIGDPHATVDSLQEMRSLISFIEGLIVEHQPDKVVFLGDQYHQHSIIHLSVMSFWTEAFTSLVKAGLRLMKPSQIFAMVGNHDMSGVAANRETSMSAHAAQVTVLNTPRTMDGVLYVPYQANNDDFVRICNESEAKIVICHQSFMGAAYDNGFYDPDGIDPNLIPQEQIISGHIHTPQSFGKVWYPGAPRWRTVNDANTERHVWLVEHGDDGTILSKTGFNTNVCCRSIHLLEDRPGQTAVIPTGNVNVIVDIYGPKEYVASRKAELEGSGARVRTFPDTEKIIRVKESDGIATAYKAFIDDYKAKHGTAPAAIWKMAQERVSWLRQG